MTICRIQLALLALSVTVALTAGSCVSCPGCPATYVDIGLVVSGDAGGGAVSGVDATVTGPQNGTMSCAPNGTATLCTWPSGPVAPGSYTLTVTAPGFQSATVSATVTVADADSCGCASGALQPSHVTLDPM